jgi:hypothetical protein
MIHELIQGGHCEYLALQPQQELPHVFTPLAESTPVDAGDDLIRRPAFRHMLLALGLQFLDAGDLVSGCSVVTRDFCLDNDNRFHLVRDTKVRRLAKSRNPFGTPCLPIGYPPLPMLAP